MGWEEEGYHYNHDDDNKNNGTQEKGKKKREMIHNTFGPDSQAIILLFNNLSSNYQFTILFSFYHSILFG